MELPAGVGLEVRGDTAGLVTSMDSTADDENWISSEDQVDSSVEENNLSDMPASTDHLTQQTHVSDDHVVQLDVGQT